MPDFHYISFSQEVIFGQQAVLRLGEALPHSGLQRLLLCTDAAMAASGHAAAVLDALAPRLAAVFDHAGPRLEDVQLDEIVSLGQANDVDSVVGLGGAVPIGMAKAAAFMLEQARTGRGAQAPSPTAQPLVPCIAIPTTYDGAEMMSAFAITRTNENLARKVSTYDPRIAPRLVVYDPGLTLDMPPDLTASSGMRALAHCFEALYSITRHPLSQAAALGGIRRIAAALQTCFREGGNLQARSEMLEGAHLAGVSFSTVAMGLHHALCHVLDELEGIPHGISDSIVLPHAIRFNAAVVGGQLLPAAEALGILTGGRPPAEVMEEVAQRVFELTGEMDLPQRLRDVGVAQDELSDLAEAVFEDTRLANNPRRIKDAGQIEALLNEAW